LEQSVVRLVFQPTVSPVQNAHQGFPVTKRVDQEPQQTLQDLFAGGPEQATPHAEHGDLPSFFDWAPDHP
jgi:hypothetical protein